jgi:AAA family ATP:ADP antiporter
MLLMVPVFGYLVSRFRRGQFIPAIYLFFSANLVFFIFRFDGADTPVLVQRAFYIWLSVFNLFVVSIFWSFMADIFRPGQAQRLFGFIMAGGSLGAIIGPRLTAGMAAQSGEQGVMAISLACLLIATTFAVVMSRYQQQATHTQTEKIGGSVWEGAISVFKSKYLLFACLMMLLHNLTSTFLYNGLAVFVDGNIVGFNERTVFFAYVDFAVQIIAFSLQFFLTSRLISTLGMPRTLLGVPLILAAGFTLLGSTMGLVLFAAVQVLQRSMNYGILGPAKEMLFTVVDRETKYKSKNFIDTAIYRGSDVTASWIFKGMISAGMGLTQIAFAYLPIMGLWSWAAWRLGVLYRDQLTESR